VTRFRAASVAVAGVAAVAVAVALTRPAAGNAWTAAEGHFADDPAAWRAAHDGFRADPTRGGARVVFLGDSYTRLWPADLWGRHFAPLGAVAYGVCGDGSAQVLWRVEHGELNGTPVKAVVLLVGVNNALLVGDSAADAARGVAAVLAAVRVRQPAATVLLLGVLPVHDPGDPVRAWVTDFNARVARLADGKAVHFADPGAHFLDADGNRRPGLYDPDRVHLTRSGYELLAEVVAPVLADAVR